MARVIKNQNRNKAVSKKKTSIGCGKFTKSHNKGGGANGSTTSKNYKKKQRGQGARRRR